MNAKHKEFVKRNAATLSEIFSDKITEMVQEVLNNPNKDNRDKQIDAINVLRDWLKETEMIKEGKEIKPTNFI